MNDETRYKAAASVVALANRAESAGRKESRNAKGGQWQPMPYSDSLVINIAKLREAVDYYVIAESIEKSAAGWGYPRALLLESIGAYSEAIEAFAALTGTPYALAGEQGSKRCREKQIGTYDEFNILDEVPLDAEDDEALDAEVDAKVAQLEEYFKKTQNQKPRSLGKEDAIREQAGTTAQTFVNHLLDRNYVAAHAMLHPWDAGMSAEELREEFEPLFKGEAFPESADVFEVKLDMPNLERDDLAWVYVTVHSENAEAVSMIITRNKKKLVVRDIEWGRP